MRDYRRVSTWPVRQAGQNCPLFAHFCHCRPIERPARPIRAEEKWAVSKWPPVAAPKPSAVPVHPSLMRQFQFQSRLRITKTETVSQIPILAMETISQSQRATHMTPLALCQQCQRSAKPGARVPRVRDFAPTAPMQHVVLFPASQGRWGPPEPELPWGAGGGDFVRQPEN